MTALIEFVRTHADLIVQIQALLVVLSGILQTLGYPSWSKIVGTLAVLDLGRVIRQAPKVPPSAGLALLALGLSGCGVSLEGSRARMAAGASPEASGFCYALSSRERAWGGIATGSSALAGTSGLAMIPVDSRSGEMALASGIVAASASAVVALYVAQSYSRERAIARCGGAR